MGRSDSLIRAFFLQDPIVEKAHFVDRWHGPSGDGSRRDRRCFATRQVSALILSEKLVHVADAHRALADPRGDALDGARPHVADGKHALDRGGEG